jgi:hypothetical protein
MPLPPGVAKGLAPGGQDYHHDDMVKRILALGLEQRELGYEVDSCLVDGGETAAAVVAQRLASHSFDCVMIGAGLRAPAHLLLFEKLLNLVHAQAPGAKICFNKTPADSAEAVQRWV